MGLAMRRTAATYRVWLMGWDRSGANSGLPMSLARIGGYTGRIIARCAVAGRAVGYQLYNEFRAGKLDDVNLQGLPRRTPPTGSGGWVRLGPRRNRYRLADNRPTPRRKTANWISGSCRRLMWVPTVVRPASRIDVEIQGFPERKSGGSA
jgi:hypothetical protein